jgi:Helix-turn-helix domain
MMTNVNLPFLNKPPVPPLVKVRDIAALFSVSRQTVHHLIDSGDLEASKINPASKERQHLRVTRASLLKFYKKRFGHSLQHALANPFES